tara:strand:- start:29873 stop:30766 length:894 start_codon:yes stop_codon:yes gene_type:complete
MRRAFAEKVLEMAQNDDKLVVLIGDISHHLLRDFEKKFPDRFYNVGICEQTIVGMAAGLAMQGFKPIVHTIAPFCVERAYEQIKVDLCYQNLDVTIVSVGASFDYAHLGCTHHSYNDVSILRSLPNMHVIAPGTSEEFETLFEKNWSNGSPKYFKLTTDQHSQNLLILDQVNIVKHTGKSQKTAFVSGHLLDVVLENKEKFESIVYIPELSCLKKRNIEKIASILSCSESVLTVEENCVIGGLGDLVFDVASKTGLNVKIHKIGVKNQFLEEYGKREQHREDLGLTTEGISAKIESM